MLSALCPNLSPCDQRNDIHLIPFLQLRLKPLAVADVLAVDENRQGRPHVPLLIAPARTQLRVGVSNGVQQLLYGRRDVTGPAGDQEFGAAGEFDMHGVFLDDGPSSARPASGEYGFSVEDFYMPRNAVRVKGRTAGRSDSDPGGQHGQGRECDRITVSVMPNQGRRRKYLRIRPFIAENQEWMAAELAPAGLSEEVSGSEFRKCTSMGPSRATRISWLQGYCFRKGPI